MKKLVKPEIIDTNQNVNALCEYTGTCSGFCETNSCSCFTKGWWADDDKDEILF